MFTKQHDTITVRPIDEKEGVFEALVAVFGNVDRQGDRIMKGAFEGTLDRWRVKGTPIPCVWSHSWQDPFAHIGGADPTDVWETNQGLVVRAKLDLSNPFAEQVFKLLESRRLTEFSFGYETIREREAKDRANELLELDIIEFGPTLKGANSATELLGTKAAAEHFGFTLPATTTKDDDAAWLHEMHRRYGTGFVEDYLAWFDEQEAVSPSRPKAAGVVNVELLASPREVREQARISTDEVLWRLLLEKRYGDDATRDVLGGWPRRPTAKR